jgi:SAM-dependent methyltransferase
MREEYLGRVEFPADARVVEVGCGTGAVARAIAARSAWHSHRRRPSPVFIEKARALAADVANLSFLEGDARSLPFDDGSLDVVVFHTTLCHAPDPRAGARRGSTGAGRRPAGDLRRRLRDDVMRRRCLRSASGMSRHERRPARSRSVARPATPQAPLCGGPRARGVSQSQLRRDADLGQLHDHHHRSRRRSLAGRRPHRRRNRRGVEGESAPPVGRRRVSASLRMRASSPSSRASQADKSA